MIIENKIIPTIATTNGFLYITLTKMVYSSFQKNVNIYLPKNMSIFYGDRTQAQSLNLIFTDYDTNQKPLTPQSKNDITMYENTLKNS